MPVNEDLIRGPVNVSAVGRPNFVQIPEAWRLHDLAVAQNPCYENKWVIVTLASGDMIPATFDSFDDAVNAMRQILPFMNLWIPNDDGKYISRDDLTEQIKDVFVRNNANFIAGVNNTNPLLTNGYDRMEH